MHFKFAMGLNQAVPLGVGFEMIDGFDKGDAGLFAESLRDAGTEFGMRVDAAADGRAADRQAPKPHREPISARAIDNSICRAKPPNSCPSRSGVASIKCVRPILMTLSHCFAFCVQRPCIGSSSAGNNACSNLNSSGDMNRRRKRVVGALPHVHVIVGMNRVFLGHPIATGNFNRAIADHLVHVHVATGAASGLKNVDRKLVGQFAVGNLPQAACSIASTWLISQRVLASAGQLAEISVGDATGVLDQAHGMRSWPLEVATR